MQKYVITKKIAKHGANSILVIPKCLQQKLRPRTMCKISFEVLEGADSNE